MTHARVKKTVSKSTSSKESCPDLPNLRVEHAQQLREQTRLPSTSNSVTTESPSLRTLQLVIVIGPPKTLGGLSSATTSSSTKSVWTAVLEPTTLVDWLINCNRRRGCSRCDSSSTQVANGNGTGSGWVTATSICDIASVSPPANAANLLPRTDSFGRPVLNRSWGASG